MKVRHVLVIVFLLSLNMSFASQFLGLDVTICKNHTVIIHNMVIREGWADYEYLESNYSLIIDSKTGRLLDFSVPVSFMTFVDYTNKTELLELECINTIVKVPYYKTMETVAFKSEGVIIKQINVENFFCEKEKQCNSYCYEHGYNFCSEEEFKEIEKYINDSCGNGLCESYLGEDDFNCEADCVYAGKDEECTREKDGICDLDCATSEDPDCVEVREKNIKYAGLKEEISNELLEELDRKRVQFPEQSGDTTETQSETPESEKKSRPMSETILYAIFFAIMLIVFIAIVIFLKKTNQEAGINY